jgi:hypothetical protein
MYISALRYWALSSLHIFCKVQIFLGQSQSERWGIMRLAKRRRHCILDLLYFACLRLQSQNVTHNLCLRQLWTVQCTGTVHSTVYTQEARYVERWPNTTSAWVSWSRFDIPVDRYAGVHSLLQCTSWTLGFPTCPQASQQDYTYWTKYQKADRASTLCTLWYTLREILGL